MSGDGRARNLIKGMDEATVQVAAVAALAVVWIGMMTWGLGRRSLTVDEFLTAYRVTGPGVYVDYMHPQTYYRYVAFWTRAVGTNDAALRSSNLIPAGIAVVCAGIVAWWLLPWPSCFVALALVCFSSELLLYWRMARYFAPAAAGFGIVMVGIVGYRRFRMPGWLALAAFGSATLAYTDYMAAAGSIVPWLWLAGVGIFRRDLKTVGWLAVFGVLSAIASIPAALWAMQGMEKVAKPGHMVYPLTSYALSLAVAAWSLLAGECLPPWQPLLSFAAVCGTGALWVAGLARGWRRTGEWRIVIAVWPAAVAIAFVAVLLAPHEPPVRIASLALYALPYALLVVALGWHEFRGRFWAKAAMAGLAVGYGAGLFNYFTMRNHLNPQYAMDWRKVARAIEENARDKDCVVTFFDSGFYRYYRGKGRQIDITQAREGPQVVLRTLRSGSRAWIIVRDRGSAEATSAARRLLEELQKQGAKWRVRYFMRYTKGERLWRRLLGRSPAAGYVTVYEVWLPHQHKHTEAPS